MISNAVEILLVEDSPQDVELTMHTLIEHGLCNTVQVARDGEEALDYIFCRGEYAQRSIEAPPRLILLDLKLPKVDGLEILREVKGDPRTKAIPVVILTASREERDLVESYHLGANGYIQKPVEFKEFQEIVKILGLYWLLVNVPPPPKAFGSL
jgi:two-component system response regulator